MTRSKDAPVGKSSDNEGGPEAGWRFAVLLARDIAFAVILVAIILGAVFAYTQVWPPMVVVESESMQHSAAQTFIGVIDTGDLVLVQAVHQPSEVVTYVEGTATGHATYSNYGDVIIFHRPSAPASSTPIIHRAIVYVIPNLAGGVDVPSLRGRPLTEWSGDTASGTATEPVGLLNLTLFGVRSWNANALVPRDLRFNLAGITVSGFLTKGDHNLNPDDWGDAVSVSRIVGKARGEMPWFGLIKLTLAPTPSCCSGWGDPRAPRNSWDSLAITLVLLPLSLFLIDYAYGIGEDLWKGWRKGRKAPAKEATGNGPPSTDGVRSRSDATEDDRPR